MPRLSELLLRHGRTTPDLPFAPGLDHGALLAASGQRAHALLASGLQPGDRCAVEAHKSIDTVVTYLACLRAGVVFVPLNPTSTAAELTTVLVAASPQLYVGETAPAVRGVSPRDLAKLGDGGPTAFADAETGPDSPVAMLFTSGTTGRPKGVPLTNTNLVSNAQALVQAWQIAESDVLLHVLPLFHTHGLFVAVNCVLGAGASLRMHETFRPRDVVDALFECTLFMGVPTHYSRLLAEPHLTAAAAASMRLFISGSAPLSAETHRAFQERTGHVVLERYGMTETSILCSNPLQGSRRPGTVGPALPGVEVRIGAEGEIEVRGSNVFGGYWDEGALSRVGFTDDGWFRTGDLGELDTDGYLWILGRSKDLIISGGFNVYPREVEEVLAAHEDVEECAVVGIPDSDLGERVVAVVVLAKGSTASCETIRAWARERLVGYKSPRDVLSRSQLPRNALGKVEKVRLRNSLKENMS